ncbi:MAG: hypothetical protein OEV06_02140 [Anaerolineae bacterium]|nr:hypothetical protein [Anaerolineae bacterium]
MTNPILDAFGNAYLKLALEIDKHIEGYVDAYIGPPQLKVEVSAGGKKKPESLIENLRELEELVPGSDAGREKYLNAYLRAVDCTLRMLAGEEFEYLDEVERLYDVQPKIAPEDEFSEALKQLDSLFPGSGELDLRYNHWRDQYNIPADKLPELLASTTAEVRRRTAAFVDLVPGERVKYVYLQGKPWPANNAYQGGFLSRIEVNTDVVVNAFNLVNLCAHECYPGHHTEAQLKEKYLYHDRGYAEEAALLLQSPDGVTAEAIATTAAELIFPNGSLADWTVEFILPAAGLPEADARQLTEVQAAMRSLRLVTSNAAIKYHQGDLNREQAIDYLRTNAMMNQQRAEKTFEFFTHPLYRSYIFSYSEGYQLLETAAQGGDKRPIFERLLVEQVLPSDLKKENHNE